MLLGTSYNESTYYQNTLLNSLQSNSFFEHMTPMPHAWNNEKGGKKLSSSLIDANQSCMILPPSSPTPTTPIRRGNSSSIKMTPATTTPPTTTTPPPTTTITTPLGKERIAFRAAMASAERRTATQAKILAEAKVIQLEKELFRANEKIKKLTEKNRIMNNSRTSNIMMLEEMIQNVTKQATAASIALQNTHSSTADIVRTSTRRGRNSYYKRLGF